MCFGILWQLIEARKTLAAYVLCACISSVCVPITFNLWCTLDPIFGVKVAPYLCSACVKLLAWSRSKAGHLRIGRKITAQLLKFAAIFSTVLCTPFSGARGSVGSVLCEEGPKKLRHINRSIPLILVHSMPINFVLKPVAESLHGRVGSTRQRFAGVLHRCYRHTLPQEHFLNECFESVRSSQCAS